MLNTKIIESIQDAGLTENEARIYLASLSLGPETAQNIAKEAGIIRTTAYSVIESLRNKGLISIEIKGLKKLFVANDPENLIKSFELKKTNLKRIIPDLKEKYQTHSGQNFIKYYEGVGALRQIYTEMLRNLRYGDKYLVISDPEKFLELDREFISDFIEKRSRLHLNIRALFQKNEDAINYQQFGQRTGWEIKFLPEGTKLISNMVILKDKIIVTQTVSPIITIVIENPGLIQLHEEEFEIIWRSVGK